MMAQSSFNSILSVACYGHILLGLCLTCKIISFFFLFKNCVCGGVLHVDVCILECGPLCMLMEVRGEKLEALSNPPPHSLRTASTTEPGASGFWLGWQPASPSDFPFSTLTLAVVTECTESRVAWGVSSVDLFHACTESSPPY